MRRTIILAEFLLAAQVACGGLNDKDSAAVWETLEAAGVASPVSLHSFFGQRSYLAPVQCSSGRGSSSMLQTHAFSSPVGEPVQGSVSGMVTYALQGCRAQEDGVALSGDVHRSFHAAARPAEQVGDEVLPASELWVDTIHGTLTLGGKLDGTCEVWVTRTLTAAGVVYQGTVCDRSAQVVLKDRRPQPMTEIGGAGGSRGAV